MTALSPARGSVGAPGRRLAVFAAGLGNLVELYDWSVFAAFSTYFAHQFFPSGNKNVALLSAFMTYAVAFFLRPVGGLLIGRFADVHGRRPALLLSVSTMACGSLAIAVMPTYASIGFLAPVLLVLVRSAQGLAIGGETSGAAAYVTEIAPAGRRGRYGSLFYVSSGAATLVAALTGVALTTMFAPGQLVDWAWRIPFAVGALLGVVTLVLRIFLTETGDFTAHRGSSRQVRGSVRYVLRHHVREGLLLLGVCAGGSVAYYTLFSALTPFSLAYRGARGSDTFIALLVGSVVFMLCLYPFGVLSDRIGRRRQLMVFSVLSAVLLVVLDRLVAPSLWQLIATFSVTGATIALFSAQNTVLVAELFPTKVRAVGLGIWLNLCAAVFGGTAPFILQAASAWGRPGLFFSYAAAICALGLPAARFVPDMRGRQLK